MSANHVEVVPLSVHTGAQINGVDLREPLSRAKSRFERPCRSGKWPFATKEMNHEQHVALSRQFRPYPRARRVRCRSGIPGNLFHREVSQSQLETRDYATSPMEAGTPTSPLRSICHGLPSCAASPFHHTEATCSGPTWPQHMKPCQSR